MFKFLKKYNVIIMLMLFWEIISDLKVIPKFLLPSPSDIILAFKNDFWILMDNSKYTIYESVIGLIIGVILAFGLSILMDKFEYLYESIMPIIVITQTIPTVAIAPLLVLWFGYGVSSKIILIVMTTFFPITIALLEGYRSVEKDSLILLKSMGATKFQEYIHVKFPSSLPYFFSGLRISVSYSIIAAVVAEWLGAFNGLGVYMIRVKRGFLFDKMFASIILISILSLLFINLVKFFEKYIVKWEEK